MRVVIFIRGMVHTTTTIVIRLIRRRRDRSITESMGIIIRQCIIQSIITGGISICTITTPRSTTAGTADTLPMGGKGTSSCNVG
jgi:hypothetical protein